jgi:galactokinase
MLLLLTERLENLDFSNLQKLLGESHCSLERLLEAQVEAIDWANRLDEIVS